MTFVLRFVRLGLTTERGHVLFHQVEQAYLVHQEVEEGHQALQVALGGQVHQEEEGGHLFLHVL